MLVGVCVPCCAINTPHYGSIGVGGLANLRILWVAFHSDGYVDVYARTRPRALLRNSK